MLSRDGDLFACGLLSNQSQVRCRVGEGAYAMQPQNEKLAFADQRLGLLVDQKKKCVVCVVGACCVAVERKHRTNQVRAAMVVVFERARSDVLRNGTIAVLEPAARYLRCRVDLK